MRGKGDQGPYPGPGGPSGRCGELLWGDRMMAVAKENSREVRLYQSENYMRGPED